MQHAKASFSNCRLEEKSQAQAKKEEKRCERAHSGICSKLPGCFVLGRWYAQAVWGQEGGQQEVVEPGRVLTHDLFSHNLQLHTVTKFLNLDGLILPPCCTSGGMLGSQMQDKNSNARTLDP